MRGHASKAFYRWLASWALAMKSPSDLGYDASRFALPPLNIVDSIVETDWRKPGHLFPGGLKGITDRADIRKASAPVIDSYLKDAGELGARLVKAAESLR